MTFKKVSKWIGFLLGIALVYIVVSVCSDIFSSRPVSLCGYCVSYVPTNSMEPTIPTSSYILIQETKDVAVGDVVVYQSNSESTKGMYIIHRIISISEAGYVFKGDHNIAADEEIVSQDQIYGKYIKTLSFLSNTIGSNRRGLFLVIVIVFVLMFLVQLINIYVTYTRDKKKEDKEKELERLRKEIILEELKKLEDKEK